MGKLQNVVITEQRIYEDPAHPESSNYDVACSMTVPDAVVDPVTGKALTDILNENSKIISAASTAADKAAQSAQTANRAASTAAENASLAARSAAETAAKAIRGSRWSSGTACTGTSATPTAFVTGISDSLVNDMYLNTSTGDTYRCIVAGDASTAKWVYSGNIKGAKGDTGAIGPQGVKGDKGDTGAAGAAGAAATIAVGTVTTGAAGSSASVTNVGTPNAAKLNFTIPQGAKGDKGNQGATGQQGAKGDKGDTGAAGAAATITIGTVTTGAAGSSASVTNVGTPNAAKLNFTIPKGDKGDKGSAATITVDNALSPTSTNPVQNKAINAALAAKFATTGGTISGNVNVTGTITATGNITGAKVYNAVWNADYAEGFDYEGDIPAPGTIVELCGDNKVRTAAVGSDMVIGVCSKSYWALAGCSIAEIQSGVKVAVGIAGQLPIKVRGAVKYGDYIVCGGDGIGEAHSTPITGQVIGRAMESNTSADIKDVKCIIQIH